MLILNKDSKTARTEDEFVKFNHVFMYLELRCLECGNIHGESNNGERVYDLSTICRLQQAQIDMIFVKNINIIQYKHEHDTCK